MRIKDSYRNHPNQRNLYIQLRCWCVQTDGTYNTWSKLGYSIWLSGPNDPFIRTDGLYGDLCWWKYSITYCSLSCLLCTVLWPHFCPALILGDAVVHTWSRRGAASCTIHGMSPRPVLSYGNCCVGKHFQESSRPA